MSRQKKSSKKEKKRAEEKKEKSKEQASAPNKEAELLSDLQRLQAEFENYKKRTENEAATLRKRAAERICTELLPIIDNFTIALDAHEAKEDEFYKGIALINAQLLSLLKEHGVEPITIREGKERFDPRLHEALMTEQRDDLEANTITQVLQEGYTIHEKVLRPAKVKVSKK